MCKALASRTLTGTLHFLSVRARRNRHLSLPIRIIVGLLAFGFSFANAQQPETLPPLTDGIAPQNFEQMWGNFDPQAEPLEVDLIKEWEEDGVVLRIVRFRIGIFKGTPATLAAVYGFPKASVEAGEKLPGLLQIHGGGQYADAKACVANAKRGYVTLSIAWAGRISASQYRVNSENVKLFWNNQTDDPQYRLTTDWGALDGYHAPSRNQGNQFPSAKPASWTLDDCESPRNSGWFLCALAARRAITFLEQQEEVDPKRLGVYGHSMGGKLTVMTAVDSRISAAAPSCGGISDRYNDSPLFDATIGDDVSLKQISCPIMFLSPANDFHGRIGDLPNAVQEIQSQDWRVTCSPHHNHQDTAPYEVATMLWFDQHLKGKFVVPQTPETRLSLSTSDHVPVLTIRPDDSQPVTAIDVYYTTQGKPNETPKDRLDTMHRFWHHSAAELNDGKWTADLPLSSTDNPLWVYANVRYALPTPVEAVGYYYGSFSADSFNISSVMQVTTAQELSAASVQTSLTPSLLIEDFKDDWQKEWFTYRPQEWARSTNKLNSDLLRLPADSPTNATLSIDVQTDTPNRLIVKLDDFVAEVSLDGGPQSQTVVLSPSDFHNFSGSSRSDWDGIRQLKLSPTERLLPGRGESGAPKVLGGQWHGDPPKFGNLRWSVSGP